MIEKTPSFKTSDGNVYATLEIAQRAELLKLLTSPVNGITDEKANPILQVLFDNLDTVRAILSCTGRRQRKAKGNGATRKRKTITSQSETK